MTARPARGEVWWCELPNAGRRPVVVLSRDTAVAHTHRAIVAPCTTTIRDLPSEVLVKPPEDPIPRPCAVGLDAITNVSTANLVERLGRLSDNRMRQLCQALEVATACSP
jgi:mRNA interferase MazF